MSHVGKMLFILGCIAIIILIGLFVVFDGLIDKFLEMF